jgi:hypothetical protein
MFHPDMALSSNSFCIMQVLDVLEHTLPTADNSILLSEISSILDEKRYVLDIFQQFLGNKIAKKSAAEKLITVVSDIEEKLKGLLQSLLHVLWPDVINTRRDFVVNAYKLALSTLRSLNVYCTPANNKILHNALLHLVAFRANVELPYDRESSQSVLTWLNMNSFVMRKRRL